MQNNTQDAIVHQYLNTAQKRGRLAVSCQEPVKFYWKVARDHGASEMSSIPLLNVFDRRPDWARQLLQVFAHVKYPEDVVFQFPQHGFLTRMIGTPEARSRTAKDPEAAAERAYKEWVFESSHDIEEAEKIVQDPGMPLAMLDWANGVLNRRITLGEGAVWGPIQMLVRERLLS